MIKLWMDNTEASRRWLCEILMTRQPVTIAGRENMAPVDVAIGPNGITARLR